MLLAEGALKAMLYKKIAAVVAVLLAAATVAGVGTLSARQLTESKGQTQPAPVLQEPKAEQASPAEERTPPPAPAPERTPPPAPLPEGEILKVVRAALTWLRQSQEADGHWDTAKFGAEPPDDVTAAAAAVLGFLSCGHTDREENVRHALTWLRNRQKEDGSLDPSGLGALALVEAYGMTRSRELKEPAERAVAFYLGRAPATGAGADDALLMRTLICKSATVGGLTVAAEDRAGITNAVRKGVEGAANADANRLLAARMLAVPMPAQWQGQIQTALGRPSAAGASRDIWLRTLAACQSGEETWAAWTTELEAGLASTAEKAGAAPGSWPGRKGEDRVSATAFRLLALAISYRFIGAHRGRAVPETF